MTTENTIEPAPIRRALTDNERQLLTALAIWCIAEQSGATDEEARQALADLNAEGRLRISGDDMYANIRLTAPGKVLVDVTREWLAYWAHTDEELTGDELRRVARFGTPEADA